MGDDAEKKSDVEYLSILHRCIRMVWVWPPETHDSLHIYKASANIIMLFYYLFGVLTYPLVLATDPAATFAEKMEAFSVTMGVLTVEAEYLACFYTRKKSLAYFQMLINFDNFGVPRNILAVNQTLNRICLGLLIFSCLIPLLSGFEAIINIRLCEKKHSNYTVCGFVTSMYYPYDISEGFLYYLHLAIQMYCFWLLCTAGAGFSAVGLSALEFTVVRIEHLKELLRDVFKDGKPDRKKLRDCMRYHAHIIELVHKFNDCFRFATTPALFNSSAVLGLTILTFFAERNIKTFLHPVCWFTAMLCLCEGGERLMEKSASVGELLYDLEWYSVDVAIQKDILFMMIRSQKVLVFECGPLGDFSVATMKKIMQGAYTYKTLSTGLDNSG